MGWGWGQFVLLIFPTTLSYTGNGNNKKIKKSQLPVLQIYFPSIILYVTNNKLKLL